MFDPKSDYALNKKDPEAIVYIDAAGTLTRLTLADFSSPEEFQRWKAWPDESYHQIENAEITCSKRTLSLHGLSEKATAVQSPEDTLMEALEQQEREELRRDSHAAPPMSGAAVFLTEVICIFAVSASVCFQTEVHQYEGPDQSQHQHFVQRDQDRQDAVPRDQRFHRRERPGRDPGAVGGPPCYGRADALPCCYLNHIQHYLAAGRILACHALPIL